MTEKIGMLNEFLSETGKLFANVPGRNEVGTIPGAPDHYRGAESLWVAPDDCGGGRKVPTMSQILSSIEYICFRKTSGSNMWAPNLLLASI